MAVRSVLRVDRPGIKSLVLISVRCCVDPRDIARLEELGTYNLIHYRGVPGSDPRSLHVGSVVGHAAVEQFFSDNFSFSCHFSFHRLLHILLSCEDGDMS